MVQAGALERFSVPQDPDTDKIEPGMHKISGVILFILAFAGWLNHLYICFTQQLWGALLLGSFFAPIGAVHGLGVWLLSLWDLLASLKQ
ncbi:hypothetical protein [Rhizobium paknamense]|uniref:TM2 domain-containing protein n=1 Tax=Rhizobium paknamense TaxID=1206817 RepID=A0ABU0I7Y7_9HYPH|nr:hypothetical protein [Rhizobium paknamense]MDQ0454346.1 hypothetical protein [Rhizobium paknamense]